MRKLLVALLGCAILAAAERVPAEQPRQSKEAPVCCVVMRRAEGTVCYRLFPPCKNSGWPVALRKIPNRIVERSYNYLL